MPHFTIFRNFQHRVTQLITYTDKCNRGTKMAQLVKQGGQAANVKSLNEAIDLNEHPNAGMTYILR